MDVSKPVVVCFGFLSARIVFEIVSVISEKSCSGTYVSRWWCPYSASINNHLGVIFYEHSKVFPLLFLYDTYTGTEIEILFNP